MSRYESLISENLKTAWSRGRDTLTRSLPALAEGEALSFRAFGGDCRITPESVAVDGIPESGPRALVISMYAANVREGPMVVEPFLSFRDFKDGAPYQGAFVANAERPLVPHVPRLKDAGGDILEALGEGVTQVEAQGDFSLLVLPFPKIALHYIFYLPDEDFPASVTCLFSRNAPVFMPVDGLADTAEYTSKKVVELLARPSGTDAGGDR